MENIKEKTVEKGRLKVAIGLLVGLLTPSFVSANVAQNMWSALGIAWNVINPAPFYHAGNPAAHAFDAFIIFLLVGSFVWGLARNGKKKLPKGVAWGMFLVTTMPAIIMLYQTNRLIFVSPFGAIAFTVSLIVGFYVGIHNLMIRYTSWKKDQSTLTMSGALFALGMSIAFTSFITLAVLNQAQPASPEEARLLANFISFMDFGRVVWIIPLFLVLINKFLGSGKTPNTSQTKSATSVADTARKNYEKEEPKSLAGAAREQEIIAKMVERDEAITDVELHDEEKMAQDVTLLKDHIIALEEGARGFHNSILEYSNHLQGRAVSELGPNITNKLNEIAKNWNSRIEQVARIVAKYEEYAKKAKDDFKPGIIDGLEKHEAEFITMNKNLSDQEKESERILNLAEEQEQLLIGAREKESESFQILRALLLSPGSIDKEQQETLAQTREANGALKETRVKAGELRTLVDTIKSNFDAIHKYLSHVRKVVEASPENAFNMKVKIQGLGHPLADALRTVNPEGINTVVGMLTKAKEIILEQVNEVTKSEDDLREAKRHFESIKSALPKAAADFKELAVELDKVLIDAEALSVCNAILSDFYATAEHMEQTILVNSAEHKDVAHTKKEVGDINKSAYSERNKVLSQAIHNIPSHEQRFTNLKTLSHTFGTNVQREANKILDSAAQAAATVEELAVRTNV